ncbi:MAG: hypothetical protein LBU61_02335 [Coriobacteriales bacterium]|jgi:hypothetical protein|nr:hypothetical protein [Coriobacteriales bacterium]
MLLTAKENMRQTIFGGKPDRFVNQYEAINLMFHPYMMSSPMPAPGAEPVVNAWGITNYWPEGTPGMFPVHTADKIVLKDIENWREYVHAPSLKFPDEMWAAAKGMFDAADGNLAYKAAFVAPGLFEQTHHLSEIVNALTYYVLYPQEMHDLIKYLTEFELELAEGICSNLKPDCIFHHDDWGTEISTFLSPEMFAEFFLEPYKSIYGYYHDHGCELVIHHSDSYAATLVPYMIEMGIDVFQGVMEKNDVPALLEKYRGKITFMGNIDNKDVDFEGWTQEDARKAVVRACPDTDTRSYIPCITQGGPGSVYPGTYDALTVEIDRRSVELFGVKQEDILAQRLEMPPLFG